MSVGLPSTERAENQFAAALGVSFIAVILLVATILHIFGLSIAVMVLFAAGVAVLWFGTRYPLSALGLVLVFMPFYPLALLLGRFFGPGFMSSNVVTVSDRIVLIFFCVFLWRRNGVKLRSPDFWILAAFGLAALRCVFGGTIVALLYDFSFVIAYAVGRVTILGISQEKRWAQCAVWIVAALSILGLAEVFIIGEGPRAILYAAVADAATENNALNAAFHAQGFSGLRESATMFGPLQFGSLCMIALIVWWAYRKQVWLGVAIAIGLVCSITRSAWFGTTLAIPVLALLMGDRRRLFMYSGLAVVVFIAAIPVIGLGDYLTMNKTGEDLSAQGHQDSILIGFQYALDHPLGVGPGNAGALATENQGTAIFIENSYLTFAAEYGILCAICFIGFLFSSFRLAWNQRNEAGYVALGILIGFGSVMIVAPLHNVFNLAAWIWFPVGLVVRASMSQGSPTPAL
jgi:hypothetical protein